MKIGVYSVQMKLQECMKCMVMNLKHYTLNMKKKVEQGKRSKLKNSGTQFSNLKRRPEIHLCCTKTLAIVNQINKISEQLNVRISVLRLLNILLPMKLQFVI